MMSLNTATGELFKMCPVHVNDAQRESVHSSDWPANFHQIRTFVWPCGI